MVGGIIKIVTIIIPCLNEEHGIAKVLDGIPRLKLLRMGFKIETIVIDNNSSDKTAQVAKAHGATVYLVKKKGKGHAMRIGFQKVSPETDYVVMIDGDASYKSEEIIRMIEPLDSGFCDVVVGSRLEGKANGESLNFSHRVVNWGFTFFTRSFYLVNISDVLTGYFAWKKNVVDSLIPFIVSRGFAIEAEMITKMAKMGITIYSVPITYDPRIGDSKISPFSDGLKIMKMLLQNLRWNHRSAPKKDAKGHFKTKLVFVSDSVWPYNKGGKEKRLFDISTRLAEEFDVHIYTMKWWHGESAIVENGVTLHAISDYFPLYSKSRRSIKQGIYFSLACLKLIGEKWDIIDVDHMPFFPVFSVRLVTWLKRKKMFATWNEVWGRKYWIEYLGALGNIAYLVERIALRLPDRILSISQHTTRKLNNIANIDDTRVVTIPIGIDAELIATVPPAAGKSDVIYVGRLLSHKHIDVLIRAVALLKVRTPKVKCLIVGNGPEKPALVKLVSDLGLERNVIFLGFIRSQTDVYAMIKSSKVFVLPSTREGFGIAVIEAFACGLPVITIDHKDNAARDLIKIGENGMLTKLSPSEIAGAIRRLTGINASKYIATNLKQSSTLYSWETILAQLKQNYLEIT